MYGTKYSHKYSARSIFWAVEAVCRMFRRVYDIEVHFVGFLYAVDEQEGPHKLQGFGQRRLAGLAICSSPDTCLSTVRLRTLGGLLMREIG